MHRALRTTALVLASGAFGLALAGAPAAAEPPSSKAQASFDRFARTWMDKLRKAEAGNRSRPKAARSGGAFTYRGYGSDFGTELRPTGQASIPYVGLLRYKERVYSCTDAAATNCTVSLTTPVTELFRFQNGRWVY